MTKRKSTRIKQYAPPPPKLDKIFDCPFCDHGKSVEVIFSRGKASISCRVCTATYETIVGNLTEPIDVYSEWIDEAERQNT